jgi:hypothetical protein
MVKRTIKKRTNEKRTNEKRTNEKRTIKKRNKQIGGYKFQIYQHYASIKTDNNIYYEIRPYPLNTAYLQYLVNMNKIMINKNEFIYDDYNLVIDKDITIYTDSKNFKREHLFFIESNELPMPVIDSKNQNIKIYAKTKDNHRKFIISDIKYLNILINNYNNNHIGNKDEIKYIEDLQYQKYNIIEHINDTSGKEYLIIGYPDPKHMNPLLQNNNFMNNLDKIKFEHKTNYINYLKNVFNIMYDNNISNDDELYKIAMVNSYLKINETYQQIEAIKTHYNLNDNLDIDEYRNKCNKLLNDKILNIFNKLNIKVRYIFHIFEIDEINKTIIKPMIVSPRQLELKHLPILNKIMELINYVIPFKFGLTNDINKIENNFYSYYQFGEIFHIETEYIHPLIKRDTFSYLYRNQISLEELIYSCQKINFWNNLSFEYTVKPYQIRDIIENQEQSGGVFENINLKDAIIFSCNMTSSYTVEIYYIQYNKLYYLELAPNLKHINNEMVKIILNLENQNKSNNPLIKTKTIFKDDYITKYIVQYNQCIYFINKFQEIISGNEQLNLFNNKWNFPTIKYYGQNPYIYNKYYTFEPLNILKHAYTISNNKISNNKILNNNINKLSIVYRNDNGYFDIDNEKYKSGICVNNLCQEEDLIFINFSLILKNDEYIIPIYKIKNKNKMDTYGKSFDKYVIWIFKDYQSTIKGNYKTITQNKLSNIFELDDYTILEEVKQVMIKLKIVNNLEYGFYVNQNSGFHYNTLHIQVLPYDHYKSPLYGSEFSQNTESRLLNLNNVVDKMKIDNKYYMGFRNEIPIFSNLTYEIIGFE